MITVVTPGCKPDSYASVEFVELAALFSILLRICSGVFRSTQKWVIMSPLPFTRTFPRLGSLKWSMRKGTQAAGSWIRPTTPVDIILLARFTVSPQMSYNTCKVKVKHLVKVKVKHLVKSNF